MLKKMLALGLMTVLVVLYSSSVLAAEPQSRIVLFEDNFDDYAAGQDIVWDALPEGLKIEGHFPAVATDLQAASNERSALLSFKKNDTPGNIGGYLFARFAPQTTEIGVTAWVWVSAKDRALIISLGAEPEDGNVGPGGSQTAISFYLHNGTIQGYSNGWHNTGYSYPLSTWFQIRIDVDIPMQQYNVFVRESAQLPWHIAGWIPFRCVVDRIDYITITNYQSTPRLLEFYVDDLVVTTNEGSL